MADFHPEIVAIVLHWLYTGSYSSGENVLVATTHGPFEVEMLGPGALERLERGFLVFRTAHGLMEGGNLGKEVVHDLVADIRRCLRAEDAHLLAVVQEVKRIFVQWEADDFHLIRTRVLLDLRRVLEQMATLQVPGACEAREFLFEWESMLRRTGP